MAVLANLVHEAARICDTRIDNHIIHQKGTRQLRIRRVDALLAAGNPFSSIERSVAFEKIVRECLARMADEDGC